MKKLATFVLALAAVCVAPALAEGPVGNLGRRDPMALPLPPAPTRLQALAQQLNRTPTPRAAKPRSNLTLAPRIWLRFRLRLGWKK